MCHQWKEELKGFPTSPQRTFYLNPFTSSVDFSHRPITRLHLVTSFRLSDVRRRISHHGIFFHFLIEVGLKIICTHFLACTIKNNDFIDGWAATDPPRPIQPPNSPPEVGLTLQVAAGWWVRDGPAF